MKDFPTQKRFTRKTISSIPDVPLPANLESKGIETDKIEEYLPKPETFEEEVQTRDHIDRPQTPLFTPVKEGIDEETQIEPNELRDFDEDVEPIVNVLTFKTLEEARMEVLEEEEIKEMKQQQMEFERIRNRELTVVQKLENKEKRRLDEKQRRELEKEIRLEMGKVFQKKLMSCVYSKKTLSNLKNSSLTALEVNGLLRKPLKNEYQTKLLPFLHRQNEEIYNNEQIVLDEIDSLFDDLYKQNISQTHKEFVEKERIRKEEEEKRRQEELKRKEEERIRRREERLRRKHEKELEALKDQIKKQLFTTAEFVDDWGDISNINSNHIKSNKTVPCIGGHFTQLCLFLELLKSEFTEVFESYKGVLTEEEKKEEQKKEEKKPSASPEEEGNQSSMNQSIQSEEDFLIKIVDLYLLKCKPFTISYTNEQLEQFKEIDPNFTTLEEFFKLESNESYAKIYINLIENNFNNDELFAPIVETFEQVTGIQNVLDFMKSIYMKIFNILRTTNDFEAKSKIKFVLYEKPEVNKDYYFGVCDLKGEIIPKTRPPADITQQLLAKKNRKNDKMHRPYFEPFFSEKIFVSNLADDKMKIVAFNDGFERVLKLNLFECICKLEKRFEEEKDQSFEKINDKYMTFVSEFKNKILELYQKEMLVMELNSFDYLPPEQPADKK